jgi:hypothetical protein
MKNLSFVIENNFSVHLYDDNDGKFMKNPNLSQKTIVARMIYDDNDGGCMKNLNLS